MTHLDLLPFCDPAGGWRYPGIDRPWTFDGYDYATDTKIAARLPHSGAVAPLPTAGAVPSAFRLGWWGLFPLPDGNAMAGVAVPDEPPPVPCGDCPKWVRRKHCEACGKTGSVAADEDPVVVAGRSFDPRYLRLLAGLPNLRSGVEPVGPNAVLLFQSGELCGGLMAMHVWPPEAGVPS